MGNETIPEPPSSNRNRCVTIEYLTELQHRADIAMLLSRFVRSRGEEDAFIRWLAHSGASGEDPLASRYAGHLLDVQSALDN